MVVLLAVVGALSILLLLVGGLIGLALVAGRGGAGRSIAVIRVNGVITDDTIGPSILGSGGSDARSFAVLANQAYQDPSVAAVVVRVNSPGGGVVASSEMYKVVKRLNAKKPVVVSMGEEAASGGYYLSCGASKIVANPSTTTGSIGVILHLVYLQGLYDKIGVKEDVIKSGPHKDIGSRPLTPEERTILQNLIDDAYGRFIDVVVEGRHLPDSEVRKLADGSVFSGQRALQKGLVDELGDLPEAEKLAARMAHIEGEPRIEKLEVRAHFLDTVQQRLGLDPTQVKVTLPQLSPGGTGYFLEYLALPPGD